MSSMVKLKDSRCVQLLQGVIMLMSITTILLFNFETNISYVFLFLRNFKISPLSVYCLLCFVLERKTEKQT